MCSQPQKTDISANIAQAGEIILQVQQISKTFRIGKKIINALHDVSFDVRGGVVTGLIGPDAAGKTTLMRLIAALLKPDSGKIFVLGKDVATEPLAIQATIGYMPQRFGLYEDLSVQENLDLYADLQGVPVPDRKPRYDELMHMTGLGPFTTRLAGRLSGGMKQKLGLACTLIRAPQLLLLDEPTVGVDPVSRRELWEIVYRLVEQDKMSVLLSTAYLDEAERCSEVIMLYEGKLLGHGKPSDFCKTLNGRTFAVSAPNAHRRHLQKKLSEIDSVVDALIQGDNVRIVTAKTDISAIEIQLKKIDKIQIQPAPPRFEDGFVDLLRRGSQNNSGAITEGLMSNNYSRLALDKDGVIQVNDVKRKFGPFYAVKGVTFQVNRGEIFGLLGANGAGKSTTFHMLCGLLPASEGTLRVAGVDLRHAAAAAREKIGYMSQKFSLYGNLSVFENLRFFSNAYGLPKQKRTEKIGRMLELFELAPMADSASGDLPLGYKQRLAMACSIMHEPEILFLDEPTSGVDPLARREFWQRINAFADAGVTIMVTTHFMEEAEYCDRIAIMAAGEILAIGTPQDIRQKARTDKNTNPTMEDAFITMIESYQKGPAPA